LPRAAISGKPWRHDHEAAEDASRRQALTRIGAVAGGGAVYRLMTSLGFAAESTFRVPSVSKEIGAACRC